MPRSSAVQLLEWILGSKNGGAKVLADGPRWRIEAQMRTFIEGNFIQDE